MHLMRSGSNASRRKQKPTHGGGARIGTGAGPSGAEKGAGKGAEGSWERDGRAEVRLPKCSRKVNGDTRRGHKANLRSFEFRPEVN